MAIPEHRRKAIEFSMGHDPVARARRDERKKLVAEVKEWLRREARPGGECGLFPERLVEMFEREFDNS